jgi:electron transport complex protein RnfG
MKDTIKLILVLTIICAVSSALLAAVYSKTKDPIAASLERRTAGAAAKVMPAGASLPEKRQVGDETFFVAKREDGQIAAVAVEGRSKNGYGGEIVLMVGLGADGRLVNYQKLVASETPGLGTKIESDVFRRPLLGRPLNGGWRVKKDGGEVDAITAATISSRAALECIRDAIAKYGTAAEALGAKSR